MNEQQPNSDPNPDTGNTGVGNSGATSRRNFLGMLGVLGATGAVAACGGGPSEQAAPTTTTGGATAGGAATTTGTAAGGAATTAAPAASGPVALKFWSNHPGGSEEVTKAIIDGFHKSQSNITVELVTAGANYEEIAQKFQTSLAGGDLPDVIVLSDVWWFRYFMQGTISPLDDLISSTGIETADYVDSLIGDYQYGGKQWALPWARSTPLFYYNKAMWAAAGLEDRAPATWEEFAEWSPKIIEANSGIVSAYQLPELGGYAGWGLQNILWGYGGGWSVRDSFDFAACDSDASVAALTFLQEAVHTHKWAGVAAQNSGDEFAAGATASTILSTGSLVGILSNAQFDVGVGFLPGGPESTSPVCPTGGAGLGIPADRPDANKAAAAEFIKFVTSPENAIKFSEATGYMPVRKSADASAMIAATPQRGVAIEQLAATRPQDYARVFLPGGDIEMANACAEIFNNSADVKGELSKLRGKLEEIYASEVEPNI